MRTVTIKAKTIDAAVEEGLKQLGISREEAVVHVIEQPSSGLFGLIRKKQAVVSISAPDLEEEPVEEKTEAPAEETPAAERSAGRRKTGTGFRRSGRRKNRSAGRKTGRNPG